MVLSGYLIKIPYWICWQSLRLTGKLQEFIFYVESEHDYNVIENILPHFEQPYRIAAKNRKVRKALETRGVNNVALWPVFPRVLMMTRHAFHRFPISGVKKIGIKHGTYHFKKMIAARKYNLFDLYIFTTEAEVQMAARKGIKNGVAGGQPKLDTFFLPKTLNQAKEIKNTRKIDPSRKTLLFTTTWDRSGLSAIDRWIDHLEKLSKHYNVCVSLHPMMSEQYFSRILNMPFVLYAQPEDLPAFMHLADVLISDTSSVMGEFCALNKPIITFAVEKGWRLTQEVKDMIRDISLQIQSIEELEQAIVAYWQNPLLKQEERLRWQKVFYGDIDQSHGKKAASIIKEYLAKLSD